jgi:mannose-6-phosphate isomerase-like protein (cupin superfamily)
MRAQAAILLVALAIHFPTAAVAQDRAEDILREQVEQVIQGMIGESIDRQLKVVDIDAGNIAVGILHRTDAHDTDGARTGIIHTVVSEVYVVLSGWGTLLTSSEMTGATEPSAGGDVVGPTYSATAVGGTIREIAEGDIVVIPAGTLHSWISIPDHVTYLSIRPDPHSALPAGYVRPEIR